MEYLHSQGFPVPAVDEMSDDGTDLVMERIDGPSMVEAVERKPWSVRRQARVLADLHQELHEVAPPDFLAPAPVGRGDRILHLDLHPLNVIVGPRGPVVIDWTNACRGDPRVDVALAWVLMSVGEIPVGRVKAALLGWGRSFLVKGFISRFDREQIAGQLRTVVEWKVKDPNMSGPEIKAMWDMVEQTEAEA